MTYLEKSLGKEGLEHAFGVIRSSVERRAKKVLVVAGDEGQRRAIQTAISGGDLHIIEAHSLAEAGALLESQYLDGLIVDLSLPDGEAIRLIEDLQRRVTPYAPPAIIYSPKPLNEDHARRIHALSRTSMVRYAPSPERLLDESTLLFHRMEGDLSASQRQLLSELRRNDHLLAGRKVLVVDDDLRNIFALTSVLQERNLSVVHAEDGRAGIELLRANPDVDVVLMDIMMPEMDGYETMRAIRGDPRFRSLPIVALTAKAMKGDREKCLDAGASDYIAKPVDLDQLFSVLRVWVANRE
jgi:CheY-like chemotaxis protein